MISRIWIDPRDKPGLLLAVMREMVGAGEISLEGWLEQYGLADVAGVIDEETNVLQRVTSYPRLDFLVLPLVEDTIQAVWKVITEQDHLINPLGIIHVQIAQKERLIFGGYDNFHRDCVFAMPGFPIGLLDRLVASGVIRSYQTAPDSAC